VVVALLKIVPLYLSKEDVQKLLLLLDVEAAKLELYPLQIAHENY
jgi:hypothetical protein